MKLLFTSLCFTVLCMVVFALPAQAQNCYTEASNNVIFEGRNGHNGSWGYAANAYTSIGEWVELTNTVQNGDWVRVTVEVQNWSQTIADSAEVTNAGLQWDSLGYYHPFTLSLYQLPDSFLNLSQAQLESGVANEVVLTSFQELRDTQLVRWSPGDSLSCPNTYFLDSIGRDNWIGSNPNMGCVRYSTITFEFQVSGLPEPTNNLVFGFGFPVSQNSSLPSSGPWNNLNVSMNVQNQPVHIGSNPRVSDWWVQGYNKRSPNSPIQEDYIETNGPTTIRHFATYGSLDFVGLPVKVELINNEVIGCGETASIDLDLRFGQTPYSFNWTGPNGFSSTSKDLSNLTDPGTYTVTITDDASPSCVLTKEFEVVENNPKPAATLPETEYGNGEWLTYRYQGGTFQNYLGRETLQQGLSFSESFIPNSNYYAEFGGCPLEINGQWSTRYRRTETLQQGWYRFQWEADRYARLSLDGGATWTTTEPSADQIWYNPSTGPVDLVLEYRDNDGNPNNSFDFQLEYLGVDDMEYSDNQQWTVFYYQGGALGTQDVYGVDIEPNTASNEIVLDWDLIARGATDGEYQPDYGYPIDLDSPYRIVFRKQVQLDPDQYDVVVDAYGDRLRWAWDGSRYWNWISSLNAPNTPWGQSNPYNFAVNVENDGVGNHRTVVDITPSGNKVAQPKASGILTPESMQLSLYPNPAQSSFQVKLSQAVAGELQLSLLDVQGKALLQQTYTGEALRRLPLELPAGVPPGVYLVQVQGADLDETLRLVVGR